MPDIAKEIESGKVMFFANEGKTPTFYFAVVNAAESDYNLRDGIKHVIGIVHTGDFIIQENDCWTTDPGWQHLKGISPEEFYEVFYSLWKEKNNA